MSLDRHYATAATHPVRAGVLDYEFRLDLYQVRSPQRVTLGDMSVFSYVADVPAEEPAGRPVVFAFNGGPGASSAFLHLSGLGPLRADVPADLSRGALPPYRVEPSASSILDVADLVFLDPAGTGYGRLRSDVDTDALRSVRGDARAFAETIAAWVTVHDRWDSPKYILGESYGSHRAVFVAEDLLKRRSLPVDGIVFVGQAVNVQDTRDRAGNIAGAIASLPLKAATAWFHGVGSSAHDSPESAAEAAMDFAHGDFATALLRGNRRTMQETSSIARRLAEITGGDAERYIRSALWETKPDYLQNLLPGSALGVSDTRYTASSPVTAFGEEPFDPSEAAVDTAYAVGARRLFAAALGVPVDEEYVVVDWDGSEHWTWTETATGASPFHTFGFPGHLTAYLREVPAARLFIATGLYDGQATVGAAEHLVRHYPIPQDRVVQGWYRGGHMLYSDPGAAAAFAADVRAFIAPSGRGGDRVRDLPETHGHDEAGDGVG